MVGDDDLCSECVQDIIEEENLEVDVDVDDIDVDIDDDIDDDLVKSRRWNIDLVQLLLTPRIVRERSQIIKIDVGIGINVTDIG